MDLFDLALYRALNKGGGDITVEPLSVTENGTTVAPAGTAYSPVSVNVQPTLQSKTVTQNGTVTPDSGYDGLSQVSVNVQPVLETLSVTDNGEYTPGAGVDGFSSVSVNVSGGGGGGASANAVNFRDYDGTIVQSYSAADFAALTAMPENPSHDGLTSRGWNWTLAKAQAYVAKYGRLEIWQMYITDDGKTRVYIHLEQGRTSPMLGVCPNGTVDVDWGDGTAHDTLTGTSISTVKWTPNHVYATPGDYVIKLTVTGSMGFYGNSSNNQYSGLLRYKSSGDSRNSVYINSIQKVEIGSGVTSISEYAFYYCSNLASVTIPDGVTSIGSEVFRNCSSLASVTIPDGVTSIGEYAFGYCYNLASVTIPDGVTSIGRDAFSYCYNLASVTIPDGVTSIGSEVFRNCSSLASVTIPDGVTSIGSNLFYYCYSLASVIISGGVTSVGDNMCNYCYSLASATIHDGATSIGSSAFSSCYSLANVTIPDSVTSIGSSAFSYCSNLASVTIHDGVTSIGSSAFSSCYSLANVTIPDSVTSIGSSAFSSCYGVAEYHLAPTTPPTLSNTNAFNNIAADCVIYVPYSTDHSILEAYKTASNWSTYASKMQEEPQ